MDVIKLRFLRWEIILDCCGGPSVIMKDLKRGRWQTWREDYKFETEVREERGCHAIGFEDGEGATSQGV